MCAFPQFKQIQPYTLSTMLICFSHLTLSKPCDMGKLVLIKPFLGEEIEVQRN